MKIRFFPSFLLFMIVYFDILSLYAQQHKRDSIEFKVAQLLQQMTLDEKIGQMNQYNGFWDVTGPAPKSGNDMMKYEHFKKGLVGSVLNVTGVENVRQLQSLVVKETRLGIPLLFGFDVIHGFKTISPIPLAESASWDLQAIENSARMAAAEATSVGINWTFAPMVDITRDPRWGRVMEGAGEDTYLGSKIAAARVRGFQGNDLTANNTLAATAKHFAGYGFAEGGRDYNTVDIGTSTLYNVVLPPFKAAVDAGVRTVMNSFNVLNGIPSTGNKFLQRDVLKGAWGFDGFVISDWGSGVEMIEHGFAKDLKEVAELSANAGSDMDMESYAYVSHLKELVEGGKVGMQTIDDAVKRILRVKYELGLFEDPFKYCDVKREKETIGKDLHQFYAFEMAKRSIVLLKNEGQLLPLHKAAKKIAIIGALANDRNSPLGNWRGAATDSTAVSVLDGFKKYTSAFKYAKGANLAIGPTNFVSETRINMSDKSGFAEAIQLAKTASVVVMVLGEHGYQSGEGRSRAELGLPGVQQELLEAVYKVNKNIVLVLMNGRPLTINWANDHIPAIVEAWQLGTQSGNAIASVLFGDYNPSGKLPMTFPKSVGQIPLYYNHLNTGRPGPKNEVFWSHYTDESNKPLYPFGYGLSYTQFSYSDLKVQDSAGINVSFTLKNTGKYQGEEVAQLYVRDLVASVSKPVKELKGFQKISLSSGESTIIRFHLSKNELSFFNASGQLIYEPGAFQIMVGGSSDSGLSQTISVE